MSIRDDVNCSECGTTIPSVEGHVRLTGRFRTKTATEALKTDRLVILCDECLKLKKYSDRELARDDWNTAYGVSSV